MECTVQNPSTFHLKYNMSNKLQLESELFFNIFPDRLPACPETAARIFLFSFFHSVSRLTSRLPDDTLFQKKSGAPS